jgi:maleate cis-trans isomerase
VNGWRGRIGVVKPNPKSSSVAIWHRYVPPGVEIYPPVFVNYPVRNREDFLGGLERGEALVRELAAAKCDVVSVSGAPPFLLTGGLTVERAWGTRLTSELGIPVLTPLQPSALAMQALGMRRIGIATYFGPELRAALAGLLAEFEIEATFFRDPGLAEGELPASSLVALDKASRTLGHDDVYRFCKAEFLAVRAELDGIFINGGAWEALPVIDFLEQDLQTRVVTTKTADMWLAYKVLRVANPVPDCGHLLRESPDPPSQWMAA